MTMMLQNLTDVHSDEHQHLIEALIGMEKVAEHINEMQVDCHLHLRHLHHHHDNHHYHHPYNLQRIHEEYGAIFDHLFRQHQKSSKQVRNDNHDQIHEE